jgi:3-polyprenyl-4-hydroxybenzoate decarboxylase
MANVKNVFVVDPDIDVFSDEQMEWALATRFRPDRDVIIERGFRASPLDPALDAGEKVSSKAGFDLTLPFGMERGIELSLPDPPTFAGKRFASVRDALMDGPKHFEELMAAVGSTDGREIVRTLEELREQATITREAGEGRYSIK